MRSAAPAWTWSLLFISCFPALAYAATSETERQAEIFKLIGRMRQKYDLGQPAQAAGAVQSNASNTLDTESRFAVGEELVFDVKLDGYDLSELFAIKSEQGYRIGIGSLTELLNLPIEVSLDNKTVQGWFIHEDNELRLNFSEELLSGTLRGQPLQVSAEQFEIAEDDLYIEYALVAAWLGLEGRFLEDSLKIDLKSKQKFPVIARLERQNVKQKVYDFASKSVLPATGIGYTPISEPVLDLQLQANHSAQNNRLAYAVSSRQDLAYFTSDAFISGTTATPVNAVRLRLSKESETGELLGPLGVTQLQLGDVSPIAVGQAAGAGRGIAFSNTPLNRLYDNKKMTIEGAVPSGWDVELYRSGVLLSSQLQVTSGRYEFLDVELFYGLNEFEVVIYGPQGQRESRTERHIIDRNEVGAGEFTYGVSVTENNTPLLDFLLDSPKSQPGISSNLYLNQGVTDWLALQAGVSDFQAQQAQDDKRRLNLGINTNLFGAALWNTSFFRDEKQSDRLNTSVRGSLGGVSWGISGQSTTYLDQDDSKLDSKGYSLSLNGSLLAGVSYSGTYGKDELDNGSQRVRASLDVGASSVIGAISNKLIYDKSEDLIDFAAVDAIEDTSSSLEQLVNSSLVSSATYDTNELLRGSFGYSKRFSNIFLRLSAAYDVKPVTDIVGYGANLYAYFENNISTDFNVSYIPQTDLTQYGLGLSWSYRDFTFNTFANYTDNNNYSIGLSTRLSFGAVSERNQFVMSGRALANSGGAVVKVYEDRNLNQKHDEFEPVLNNVVVSAAQSGVRAKTDASGHAVLAGIPSRVKTDILVDADSLDDGRMAMSIPGYSIKSRGGFWERLELPVSKVGDIEGTLYFLDENNQKQPADYVGLNLIDSKGSQVATVLSEYDGYYLFVNVLPGRYRVEIDPKTAKRRGMRSDSLVQFRVKGGEDLVDGTEIVLHSTKLEPGFAVKLRSFTSLPILKAYWKILHRDGANFEYVNPFYLTVDSNYQLFAGFFQDKTKAESLCQQLNKKKASCEVVAMEYKL